MSKQLALHIVIASCRCGHKWTHSHLWLSTDGVLGGTPSPLEEEQSKVTSIIESRYTFGHCFRCVAVALARDPWPTAQRDLNPRTAPPLRASIGAAHSLDLDQLEDDIFK